VLFSVGGQLAPLVAASFRSFGFDVVNAPQASGELLALGRRDCSGKECLPYQLIWGSFRRYLEQHPPDRRTLLIQISGRGACRNCMFSIKDQLSIERMGLAGRVALRHLRTDTELGWRYVARLYSAVIAWDLLNQLASYQRPLEREPGAVDRVYHEHCRRLGPFLERPIEPEMAGFRRERRDLHQIVESAAAAFRGAARPPSRDHRTVFLSGDMYIRLDEFASDGLVRRLNARGLSVLVEPLSAFQEYLADVPLVELLPQPRALIDNTIIRYSLKLMRHDLYSRVRDHHPWLPETDVEAMAEERGRLLDRHPEGEAALTVGGVLHAFAAGHCDGAVVASPWGCGPALVSEALLRHAREIPLLFVYCDGSPIDERRLSGFAFRLRREPPRAREAAAARGSGRERRASPWRAAGLSGGEGDSAG
jgi:predicted nucleotide-binding protein (sugar kinase/HSP70/actin superfamily)